ncbi:MAG TPA: hypothetical protein VKY26_08585 [Actinomycetota bacterium]|nr:hypothetical protein [Actinomycetota bacterium]
MTMTEKGDSVAASCAAEIAQLERARCRVLEYGGGTSGEALGVVAVALSTVTKRTRRLRRALEHCRSAPGASRAVRP